MKETHHSIRAGLPWVLGLLGLGLAGFLRVRDLAEGITRLGRAGRTPDASRTLIADLDALRPKLPERGRISLLLQGQEQARLLRPLIDSLAPSIAEYYRSGKLPEDQTQAALIQGQAEMLRPGLPGLHEGRAPDAKEIADLLEKVQFASLDSATHTLAQYALAPLILDPVLRPGLVLARLPEGQARSEAMRLGLRWKKAVGNGWYLLEKRP